MFSTGILVLTSPLHTLPLRIAPVLSSAAQVVERTLYVHLHPGLNLGAGGGQPRPVFIQPVVDLSSLITGLYSNAAYVCGHLDVRVLLTNVRAQPNNASSPETGGTGVACNPFPSPQPLSHSPEVVLTDFAPQDPGQSPLVAQCLQKYTGHCYVCTPGLASVLLHPQLQKLEEEVEEGQKDDWDSRSERMETYSDVVVGGTFDRLHGAHKTLLNISCLLANKRFLIGVCDQELLKSKWNDEKGQCLLCKQVSLGIIRSPCLLSIHKVLGSLPHNGLYNLIWIAIVKRTLEFTVLQVFFSGSKCVSGGGQGVQTVGGAKYEVPHLDNVDIFEFLRPFPVIQILGAERK